MQKKRYTHGGYKPLSKKVEKYGDGNLDEIEKNRPIFRGFVGGDAFVTKKGYRGMRIDSMWVQNIFESFKNDDEELAQIAIQSQLANLNDVVSGGYQGSPYSIGDYGFYAKNVFDEQAKLLSADERAKSKASSFLSSMEWELIDEKLSKIAHHGEARFLLAYRGDSFCALAIRQNAYRVAKVFIDAGIDPLIENEEGHDIFEVVKQQYAYLGQQLKEVQDFKENAQSSVMVPTAVQEMLDKESSLVIELHNLVDFAQAIKETLEKRLADIANDKIIQRRLQLRHMDVPANITWNINQLPKVERYLKEIIELKQYVEEKLHFHSQHAAEFENLADILQANYDLFVAEQLEEQERHISTRGTDGFAVPLEEEDSFRLPGINQSSGRPGGSRPVTSGTTGAGELEPILEQDETEENADERRTDRDSVASSDVNGSTPRSRSVMKSGGISAFSDGGNSNFNTPRSILSSNAGRSPQRIGFSSKSNKSSKSPARLSSKEELYDRLGVTKAITIEQSNKSAPNSPFKSKSPQKSPTKLMEVKTTADEYLPVIGTLNQSEHSVTLYR